MAAIELRHTILFNDPNLVAYYQLESTNDSKGSNTLTNNNSVAFNAAKFNNGADFGATNTNKSLSVASNLGIAANDNISISFWVKMLAEITSGNAEVFLQHRTQITASKYFQIYYDFRASNRVVFIDNNGNGSSYQITLGTADYYHFVIIRDASNSNKAILYINGVPQISNVSQGASSPTGNFLNIGTDGSNFSSAIIDDIAIFNRVLIAQEVSDLYNGNLAGASSPSSSVSASVSPSSSISPSASISPSSSISPSISPSASKSPSSSLSPSSSMSASVSQSSSISPSISPSASKSPSPSAGFMDFTRGRYAVLPSNDSDLSVIYSVAEENAISGDDDIIVGQKGTQEYMVHQFKVLVGEVTFCEIEFEGESTLAPSLSPVYLQIYNHHTNIWETIDSDNSFPEEVTFELFAKIKDLTNYKDGSNIISCRAYQLAI